MTHKTHFASILLNYLQECLENHPRVIPSPNSNDTNYVMKNGNLCKKNNYLLQISVCALHNYF